MQTFAVAGEIVTYVKDEPIIDIHLNLSLGHKQYKLENLGLSSETQILIWSTIPIHGDINSSVTTAQKMTLSKSL